MQQSQSLSPETALAEQAIVAHRRALDALDSEQIGAISRMWVEVLRAGGRLFFCGNGGSAADAQHLAAELVVRFVKEGRALPATALSTDTSILTACSNDFGYEQIFSRQLEALARPGDLLVAISTSGSSANVLHALKTAQEMGMRALGFCGRNTEQFAPLCELVLSIDAAETARVQELHILAGHIACAQVDAVLR